MRKTSSPSQYIDESREYDEQSQKEEIGTHIHISSLPSLTYSTCGVSGPSLRDDVLRLSHHVSLSKRGISQTENKNSCSVNYSPHVTNQSE